MDGSIEKKNNSNDGLKDKLKYLKNAVEKNGYFIPDSVEAPLKEGMEMAEYALKAQDILKEITKFLNIDVDFDIMSNLDEIKEVLMMLKTSAIWLKDSAAGEFIVNIAAEVVEEIAQFEEMADALKVVGIDSKEGKEIAEDMREILKKIIKKLNIAIEAIEFVKVLNNSEMNWDGVKKMMKYIESKK